MVCPACWDPDQPQLQLGMYPVDDPQAVRNPRPDNTYYQAGYTGLQLNQNAGQTEDGFGDPNNSMWLNNACAGFTGYVLNNNDCDDNNFLRNANAIEICNGVDDNCDGQIDNNNALNFDGINDYVRVPEPGIGVGEFTIEFWMKPETDPFDQMYLVTNRTFENDNSGNWYRISLLQGGFDQSALTVVNFNFFKIG
jgi:hypothetical protein